MTALPKPEAFIVEIEQEVLGSMMLSSEVRRISGIIRSEHFIEPLHAFLFGVMMDTFDRFGTLAPNVVLKAIPDIDRAAWEARLGMRLSAYLAQVAANTLSGPAYLERSAKKVVAQWARLKVAEEASRIATAAQEMTSDPLALIQTAGQVFDDISAEVRAGPRRKTRMSLGAAAGNAFAAAEEARQRGSGLTGITWGLTDVNQTTGGIQRRDLTLIGARPSAGKTTVALSTAIKAAKKGHGVGFISLEMDADKLAARAISDIAHDWHVKIPYADIIRGQVDAAGIDALKSATQDLDQLPLIIEEQSGLSITDIRVKTEAMMQEFERAGKGLDVLMIDHLGLIRAASRYSGNRVQEISEMTAALKSLAREYGIAVVLLSQLNRAVESRDNKRPQLSDLRDSGSIEQDADTIIFLYREAYYLEREKASGDKETDRLVRLAECQNTLEFIISKQRNGPLKTIELFAEMSCAAIRNGARM